MTGIGQPWRMAGGFAGHPRPSQPGCCRTSQARVAISLRRPTVVILFLHVRPYLRFTSLMVNRDNPHERDRPTGIISTDPNVYLANLSVTRMSRHATRLTCGFRHDGKWTSCPRGMRRRALSGQWVQSREMKGVFPLVFVIAASQG